MKTLHALCVGLVIMSAAPVRAQDDSPAAPRFTRATFEQTEKALLEGLESKNPHILNTIALTVRDLKTLYPERPLALFVIPLMRIVKDENAEQNVRVSAAIALHELRSAMGDFAISRTAQFTNNARVKHICSWLAHYALLEKYPELSSTVDKIPIEISMQPLEEFAR